MITLAAFADFRTLGRFIEAYAGTDAVHVRMSSFFDYGISAHVGVARLLATRTDGDFHFVTFYEQSNIDAVITALRLN